MVQVTSVETERLNGRAVDTRQRRLKSDVPLNKLTAQDRIDETNRLMTALRIPERAPTVRVLGFSKFTYTNRLPLDDPQLEEFARRIGADYVVVAEQYGGQTNQTVMYPMTTVSSANATVNVTGSSGYSASGYGTSSGTSTTLVPMQVQRNVFIHSAVFIRKLRPQDPPYK